MVEIPDELRVENTDSGETMAMKALVARLEAQVSAQQEQLSIKDKQIEQILTAKDKQIEQLHVLLQQTQAALPSPRNLRPWWKWWGSG
jgi:hypothetical protein